MERWKENERWQPIDTTQARCARLKKGKGDESIAQTID